MSTVAAYLRTSAQVQADNNGTAAQRHELEQWAFARGIIPVWYIDEAKSGKSMDRPEWNRLMEDIRAGKVEMVVSYCLTRLGRNVRGLLDFVEEINTRGIRLVLLKDNVDTTTPMGRCCLTIMASIAQVGRENSAENVSSGLKAKAATGARWGRNQFKYDYDELAAMVENVGYKETLARTGASPSTVFKAVAKVRAKALSAPASPEHTGST